MLELSYVSVFQNRNKHFKLITTCTQHSATHFNTAQANISLSIKRNETRICVLLSWLSNFTRRDNLSRHLSVELHLKLIKRETRLHRWNDEPSSSRKTIRLYKGWWCWTREGRWQRYFGRIMTYGIECRLRTPSRDLVHLLNFKRFSMAMHLRFPKDHVFARYDRENSSFLSLSKSRPLCLS